MATASGIAVSPETLGAFLYKGTVTETEAMSVDGLTVGSHVFIAEADGEFVLSVSDDVVDHTTVLEVSGYDGLRWIAFTAGASTLSGDVTGTAVGTDIATTLVKVGGVAITATGTSLMTSASAATARATLSVDILKAGTNLTDADQTIQPFTDKASQYTLPAATLSTNRTKTLGTTSVVTSTTVTIIRRDLTANTMAVINGGGGGGTLITFAASPTTPQAATFFFDGTNWSLISFFYVTA